MWLKRLLKQSNYGTGSGENGGGGAGIAPSIPTFDQGNLFTGGKPNQKLYNEENRNELKRRRKRRVLERKRKWLSLKDRHHNQ